MAGRKLKREVEVIDEVNEVVSEVDNEVSEVEEICVEDTEQKTEPIGLQVEPTVVEEAKATVTSNNGNVRIRANRKHHCFIGGTHYYLEKGQCYNVPMNVKEILNRAGILAPL